MYYPKILYLSYDLAQEFFAQDPDKSIVGPRLKQIEATRVIPKIGKPMTTNGAIGRVIKVGYEVDDGKEVRVKEGDLVFFLAPWTEYVVFKKAQVHVIK